MFKKFKPEIAELAKNYWYTYLALQLYVYFIFDKYPMPLLSPFFGWTLFLLTWCCAIVLIYCSNSTVDSVNRRKILKIFIITFLILAISCIVLAPLMGLIFIFLHTFNLIFFFLSSIVFVIKFYRKDEKEQANDA